MIAAEKGHLEVCKTLLVRGADPSLVNQVARIGQPGRNSHRRFTRSCRASPAVGHADMLHHTTPYVRCELVTILSA